MSRTLNLIITAFLLITAGCATNTTTTQNEPLLFLKSPNQKPTANLLYPPTAPVTLTNFDASITYPPNTDYLITPNSQTIHLTKNSRIPFKNIADLQKPANSPNTLKHLKNDPNTWLWFNKNGEFHKTQTLATYKHDTPPQNPPAQKLQNAIKKLSTQKHLTIGLIGDSISAGHNSSQQLNLPPYKPPYPQILKSKLEKIYHAKITLHNLAVPGQTAASAQSQAKKLAPLNCDLVIIAYGMNDVFRKNPEQFKSQINKAITQLRKKNNNTEIILVATMLANPNWSHTPQNQFPPYRNALKSLTNKNTALADLTQICTNLLQKKSYYDLTGNGVNHPNDFTQNLYAKTILKILTKK
jgi:lysophospholipase L1-like esterase